MGTQQGQGAGRQGHGTVLIAFARANVQLHARTINLGDLKMDAFKQTQATGVDHTQADAVVRASDVLNDAPDFLGGKDDRQLLWDGRTEYVTERPGAREGVGGEELDGVEGDVAGVGGDPFLVAQREEIPPELLLGDSVGRLAVVDGELLHRAEVGLLGAGGQATQLHGLRHPLAERGHRNTSYR